MRFCQACFGGCIDTLGWAELVAIWPGVVAVFLHARHRKWLQLQLAEARLLVSAAPFAHSEAQACSSTKVGQTSDSLRWRSTSVAT